MKKFCVCGNVMDYDLNAPKSCNKCKINFADAFRKTLPSIPKKVDVAEIQDDSEYEYVQIKRKKKVDDKSFGGLKHDSSKKTFAELEAEDFVDNDSNENAVDIGISIEEIKGSLNESDILVSGFEDQVPEKLGKFLPKKE